MPSEADPVTEAPIAVLVVDDNEDIRAVVKLMLEIDGRYMVVGEAADGVDGIALAEALQPDVVILDRTMPRMSGIDALPGIHRVAPSAAVVLYTAESDEKVHQAAIAAGAIDVVTKGAGVRNLAGLLADALLRTWADPDAALAVHVGPVSSTAALEWIDNTTEILEAVRSAPSSTDVEIDAAVFDTFSQYLASWREIAEANDEFVWAARAAPGDVDDLLDAWASIDRIDDDTLRQLGCSWSAGRGRSFFDALTAAVINALERHQTTLALAGRLQRQWQTPMP